MHTRPAAATAIVAAVALLALVASLAACGSGPSRPGAADEPVDIRQQQRSATAAIEAIAEVADADLHLVAEPGRERIAHVAVTLRLAGAASMNEALAQQVVGHVNEAFPNVPAHRIAVRDAEDEDFLYIGGVGVIE